MMMMAREMQVKQYVAVVANSCGAKFMVFETGDSRYYLFAPLVDGCQTGLQVSVEKKRLRPDVKRALRHGWGNAGL